MEEKSLIYDDLNFAERRQSDRKKLIVDVCFEGGDATGIANTTDISLGGLFLKTNAVLLVGKPILLRLTLSGREISIEGKIEYQEKERGFGISFDNLSPEKILALQSELG